MVRTRAPLGFILAAGALVALAAVNPTLAREPLPVEQVSLNFLPEGPGGIGSRAAAVIPLPPINGVDVWEHAVAGSLRQADGRWVPAFWLCNNETIEGPILLNSAGRGGRLTGVAVDPTNPNIVYFSGTQIDDRDVAQPALWRVDLGRFEADALGNLTEGVEEFLLPAPTGGEALGVAVGDINNDGVADIIVSGFSFGDASVRRLASIWVSLGDTPFRRWRLPPAGATGNSEATTMSASLENIRITGYAFDPAGHRRASLWTIDAGETIQITHTFLPGDAPSAARTQTVDNDETITVGGSRTEVGGREQPALWFTNSNGGTWKTSNLALPGGFDGGRVNGIIAILIGLVAAGDVSGPAGQSAALWQIGPGGAAAAIDLNDLYVDLPPGVRLTEASFLLPYVEQDNLFYVIVGGARDAAGQAHGFVALAD